MRKSLFLLVALAFAAPPARAETALPDLAAVRQALAAMPKARPLLFAARGGLARLRANAATPLGKAFAARVIADATLLLSAAPFAWNPSKATGQILGTSRAVLYRINTLGVAYLLTGDQRYARRGVEEMAAVAAFPNWNPAHFLDVAEMSLAFAVGYDWFYPELTPEEQTAFRCVLLEKGLKPAFGDPAHLRWVAGENNWTQVCHAGMTAAALAISDTEPELAARTIHRAVVNLPRVMNVSYGSQGAYPEGPTYWGYGTEFNAVLLALLDAAFGNDFGLAKHPGFRQTGAYITAMQTPGGALYTYGDSNSREYLLTFAKIWWCVRFRRPDCFSAWDRTRLGDFCRERHADPAKAGERLLPLALFALSGELVAADAPLPLSYFSGFDAATPVAVHRSDATGNATYLAIKGGRPDINHGHMDGGSFILEAGGVRWIDDLGAEGYGHFQQAQVRLWDSRQGSDRWKIFRYSPRSHSIFMIDGAEQQAQVRVPFTAFHGDNAESFSELDLSGAYAGQLKRATRRARLLPDGRVTISDRLEGLRPGAQITWQLCVNAVEVSATDGPELTLAKAGRTMQISAAVPGGCRWEVLPAAHLSVGLRTPDWRHSGKYLLGQALDTVKVLQFTVTAPADGNLALEVRFALN